MKVSFIWTLAVCVSLLPTAVQADARQEAKSVLVQNVQLSEAGTVQAKLVDEAGKPIAGKTIELHSKTESKKVTTDQQGSFQLTKAQLGHCGLKIDDNFYACRVWGHNQAPPKSLQSITVVQNDGPIYRAQSCGEGCDDGWGGRRLGGVTGQQWLGLALLAGVVVAVVLAVDNDDAS